MKGWGDTVVPNATEKSKNEYFPSHRCLTDFTNRRHKIDNYQQIKLCTFVYLIN